MVPWKVTMVENPARILIRSWKDLTTGSCPRILPDLIGSYRILCRILKNPVGPFEDFFMILNVSQVYYRIFKRIL